MTAPIVVHYGRKPLTTEALDLAKGPGLARDIAAVRRDWDEAPKGQLWERLAEVTLEDVQWQRVYFPKLRTSVHRALRAASTRRAADALLRPRVVFSHSRSGGLLLAVAWQCTCGKSGLCTRNEGYVLGPQRRASRAAQNHLAEHRP